MVIMLRGGCSITLCQMCTYWFPHCQPSSKFPLWWTVSSSTFGTSTILGSIMQCTGQHGETCTSALYSISCYHMERFCFSHFDFCGCRRAEDVTYFGVVLAERQEQTMCVWKQTASSQRQFVIQYRRRRGGDTGIVSRTFYQFWDDFHAMNVWISLICHQRRCTFPEASVDTAAF